MEGAILQVHLVDLLAAHALDWQRHITQAAKPDRASRPSGMRRIRPGNARKGRDQKTGTEMHHRRRGEGACRVGHACLRPLCDQGHDHELQADQRAAAPPTMR